MDWKKKVRELIEKERLDISADDIIRNVEKFLEENPGYSVKRIYIEKKGLLESLRDPIEKMVYSLIGIKKDLSKINKGEVISTEVGKYKVGEEFRFSDFVELYVVCTKPKENGKEEVKKIFFRTRSIGEVSLDKLIELSKKLKEKEEKKPEKYERITKIIRELIKSLREG